MTLHDALSYAYRCHLVDTLVTAIFFNDSDDDLFAIDTGGYAGLDSL